MVTDLHLVTPIVEYLLFLVVTNILDFSSGSSLKISHLHIPTPVVTGDSALLRCGFELGDETLYAVKWYRNMAEFFRYVPASDPPFKTFPQHGIDVDVSKSDRSAVFLRDISSDSFGNYTCQVSTDKPHFRCVQSTRHLEVLVPPSDGPMLAEEKSDYEVGDNVSIWCISGKSRPAPDLKWYINDQPAKSEPADRETVIYSDQLESSSLGLRFLLRPDVLHDGKVTLKCVATIRRHVYSEAVKEIRAAGSIASISSLFHCLTVAVILFHLDVITLFATR